MRFGSYVALFLTVLSGCEPPPAVDPDAGSGAECESDEDCSPNERCATEVSGQPASCVQRICFCNDEIIPCQRIRLCEPVPCDAEDHFSCNPGRSCLTTNGQSKCENTPVHASCEVSVEKRIMIAGEETPALASFFDAQGKLIRTELFRGVAVCNAADVCEQEITQEGCISAVVKVYSKPPAGGMLVVHGEDGTPSAGVRVYVDSDEVGELTDIDGVVRYQGVAHLIVVEDREHHEVFFGPPAVIRYVNRNKVPEAAAFRIETDFSDAGEGEDVRLSISGGAFKGDVSHLSLASIFGERSERLIGIGANAELQAKLALPESTFVEAGDTPSGGIAILPRVAESSVLWSFAMVDSYSGFAPKIDQSTDYPDFILDESGYLNGLLRHDNKSIELNITSDVGDVQDLNNNNINDSIRSANPLVSVSMFPRTIQTRSARSAHLSVAEGQLLAVVAIDVPAVGLVPLGFREFAEGEEGDVEFATPHDGFEGLEPKLHSLIYGTRPWRSEQDVRYSNGDVLDGKPWVSIAAGEHSVIEAAGNSPSKISTTVNDHDWIFWVFSEGSVDLTGIPSFDFANAALGSVTSFQRNDVQPDMQIVDGSFAGIESFSRTQSLR